MRSVLRWSFTALLVGCGSAGPAGPAGPAGSPGPQGPAGTPGTSGAVDPALAQVTPEGGFAARTAQVQIIGIGTSFTDMTTVDFGDPEIKVTKVEARSKANLRVDLDVGGLAKFAPHDLTVTIPASGGQAQVKPTFKGAFTPLASLVAEVPIAPKDTPQGGVVLISVRNLDVANPFAGFVRPTASMVGFGNMQIMPTNILGSGFVDPAAPVGGLQVVIGATNAGKTLGYVLDPADVNAPKIVARTPTDLTIGTAKTGEAFLTAAASNLYKIAAPADEHVVVLSVTNPGAGLTGGLFGALAPQSGRFRDGHVAVSSGTTTRTIVGLLPKMGDNFVTVAPMSLGGGGTSTYTVTAKTAKATKITAKEPMTADTPGMPIATFMGPGPAYATDGAIESATDVDYIAFKAEKTGPIYVAAAGTGPGASFASSISVAIHNSTCAGVALGASTPVQQQINATANTTYCARITGLQAVPYTLVITQDP